MTQGFLSEVNSGPFIVAKFTAVKPAPKAEIPKTEFPKSL
jgi:hypothetical protein